MSKYNRDEIIRKLKNNRLRPLYSKKSHKLYGFSKSKNINIGIKLWGYLDFLKVGIIKK